MVGYQFALRRNKELAAIHVAKRDLGLDDVAYREVVNRISGGRTDSSGRLTQAERTALLEELRGRGFGRAGDRVPSRKQLFKIRRLWTALWNLGALAEYSPASLDAFCKRTAGVDKAMWLNPTGANQVIEGLKAWCGREGFEASDNAMDAKRGLLRAIWAKLRAAGALKSDRPDALDVWAANHAAPRRAGLDHLDAKQLDRAADALGAWLRGTGKEKTWGITYMSPRNEEKPAWWSSDYWATPPEIVSCLESEFGAFDLDPCCRPETAKARKFFVEADDGLAQQWHGRVFLNPPYSNPAPWLQKAIEETETGRASLVVALLPVSTDTAWFHDLVKPHAEIRFVRGRIRFYGWKGTPIGSPRTPSMFAIYRGT